MQGTSLQSAYTMLAGQAAAVGGQQMVGVRLPNGQVIVMPASQAMALAAQQQQQLLSGVRPTGQGIGAIPQSNAAQLAAVTAIQQRMAQGGQVAGAAGAIRPATQQQQLLLALQQQQQQQQAVNQQAVPRAPEPPQLGFTQEQLVVLKEQIMLFKAVKKGTEPVTQEALQKCKPPPLPPPAPRPAAVLPAASRTNPPGRAAVGVAADVADPRDEDGIGDAVITTASEPAAAQGWMSTAAEDDTTTAAAVADLSLSATENDLTSSAAEIEPSAASAAGGDDDDDDDDDDDEHTQDQAMVSAAAAAPEAAEIEASAAPAADDYNDDALVQNQAMVTAAAAAAGEAAPAPDAAAHVVATAQEGATPTADVPVDLRQSLLFDPLILVDRPSLVPPTAAICSRVQTVRGLAASGRALELLTIPSLSGQQAASCVIQAVALQAVIESVQAQSFKLVNRRPLLPLAAMAAMCSSSQLLDTLAAPPSSTAVQLLGVPSTLPGLTLNIEDMDDEGLRAICAKARQLLSNMRELAQSTM